MQLTRLLILFANGSSILRERCLAVSDIKDNNKKDYDNKGLRNRSGKDSTNEDKNKPIAKLLVVDDDPDIAHVLKLALQKKQIFSQCIYPS
jgi:PleD family two-component response regulator